MTRPQHRRGNIAGQTRRGLRRQDRQHDIGLGEQRVEIGREAETQSLGARPRRLAAAGNAGDHVMTVPGQRRANPTAFRSHQMLIGLLRSRHGSWTVPGDVRELLDVGKLVSSAVRQAGGPVFGPD